MDDDKKPYNFLAPYLTDVWAEEHGVQPIVLDMAEITQVEYLGLFEPEPERLKFLEGICHHKINANEPGGYNAITVQCPNPEHGVQHYYYPSGEDPTEHPIYCRICRKERMDEIDRQREKRKFLFNHPEIAEKERQKTN